ncbi:hypothetical protein [Stieleria tagensis]|uniref:hypothetical protein n=1 Tax=Stieleria tagensis TaxID=2956795 RepID=UPI00209A98E9|nr:hypothetical protein [Stieleria tagensis]
MASRLWQIPAGMVTTLLIALFFDPAEQGVYYLIVTLTGLQALADAGLINTLLHAASHEAAGSRLDQHGFFRARSRARARLAGMLRFGVYWFLAASVLLVVLGGIAGLVLFARQGVIELAAAPLLVAMLLAGIGLLLSPLVAILEGCNQVHTVNRFRLGQVISGSFVVWACLASGFGLWAAAAAIATQLAWELGLILIRYRKFFAQLIRTRPQHFDWRHEIWPLQWRIGFQSVVRYLAFLPILPVLFDSQGPEVAGRYGMTWQVISNLLMVAYVYVRTRSPEFGRLIAENRRPESNAAFLRATVGSTGLLLIMSLGFCAALALLNQLNLPLAQQISGRFLSPLTCLCFALAVLPIHTTQCFALHIRSQRFDPIWRVNLPACGSLAVLTFFAARAGAVVWIAAAMGLVFSLSTIALAAMWNWYRVYFDSAEQSE